MKIKGLKTAVGDYRRVNKGRFSAWYGKLMFDKSDGELWTDVFYNLGQNEWKVYHSDTIVNLGEVMSCYGIKVTMKNVKAFIQKHYS